MPLIILIQIGMIMLSRLSILSFLLNNVEEARRSRSGCPCMAACAFLRLELYRLARDRQAG